ncbi:MAG: hypothetical protein BGO41_01340 [Clostridiales bacterium 38-18]|nr:MAG: hypothetical protein BGO41_01340 [Clostridiales bacterium 38-18]
MNKLTYKLADKMISDDKLTSFEFDFLVKASKRADEYGIIKGLYYNEFSKELNCHVSTYYNLLESLENRGYIRVQKNHNTDIDVVLLQNSFYSEDTDSVVYGSYINLGVNLFWDDEFYRTRVGAKRLMLWLLKRVLSAGANDRKKMKSSRDFYSLNKLFFNKFEETKEIVKLLKIQARMIKEYYHDLMKWVSYESKVNLGNTIKDVVTVKRKSALNGSDTLIADKKTFLYTKHGDFPYHLHYVKTFCRRFKVNGNREDFEDVAGLIGQYRNKASKLGKDIFNMVTNSIQMSCFNKPLDGRSVHQVLRNILTSVEPF